MKAGGGGTTRVNLGGFCTYWGKSSWAVARQLHLFYARRPPDQLSKSLPVCFFFSLRSVVFQNWKTVVFKRAHIFFSQFCPNSLDEVGSRRLFFPLFSGALWTPFKPGPAAARCQAEPESYRSLLLGPRPLWAGLWVPDPGSLERCPGPPWVRRWSLCSGPGAILGAGSSSSAPIYARRCWRNPLMTRYLLTPGSR